LFRVLVTYVCLLLSWSLVMVLFVCVLFVYCFLGLVCSLGLLCLGSLVCVFGVVLVYLYTCGATYEALLIFSST